MYGWDSAFIVLGLLRDGRWRARATWSTTRSTRSSHYGGVLNANRTYSSAARQPPLLGRWSWAVYAVTGDRAWLARAREAVARSTRTGRRRRT